MAELGTRVTYLATEESEEALRSKVITAGSELSTWFFPFYWNRHRNSRFSVRHVSDEEFVSLADVVAEVVADLEEIRSSPEGGPIDTEVRATIAFSELIVVDSLTALLVRQEAYGENELPANVLRQEVASSLEVLRARGVAVLLVGTEYDARNIGIAHLVDNVFVLSLETERSQRHPIRLLTIEKTRVQESQRGQHILHLSGPYGCSVSPSLPSVLNVLKRRAAPLPDEKRQLILWAPPSQRTLSMEERLAELKIRSRSQILVYGQGSTGKSRFALWLAFKSAHRDGEEPHVVRGATRRRRVAAPRVLVVSFLYEEEYYRRHADQIIATEKYIARGRSLETLSVLPGFVDPETVVSLVRQRLRRADLLGEPFSAVVLDGLHNITVQFPLLENEALFIPALFRLLRTRHITTVSTFTLFAISAGRRLLGRGLRDNDTEDAWSSPSIDVSRDLLEHLLIASSDYVFGMGRVDSRSHSDKPAGVVVTLEQTLNADEAGPASYWWDASQNRLVHPDELPLSRAKQT